MSDWQELPFDEPRRAVLSVSELSARIKAAIESIFSVSVENVSTLNVRGKEKRMGRNIGRRPNWKKAIVTLREGDTIEIFEG